MRKAITIMIVLALGVSLWADGTPAIKTKGQTVEIRFPDHRPSDRTETYELYMVDAFGDGWNGASVDLSVNGALVIDDASVPPEGDEAIATFDVNDFDYITTAWTSGNYDYECAYAIYDASGNIVAEAGTADHPELSLTHTVDVSGVNIFANSGFEGGTAEWGSYPSSSFDVITTGDGMYNSDDTFTAYDGAKSFKMWGLYWDGASENNLFHEWSGDDAVAMVGQTIDMSAWFYSHNADFIGLGNSHGKLTAKYFGPGTNGEWWNDMLFMDESAYFDASTATADTWTNYTLSTTVPEGVHLMQLGFMLYQPTSGDHGSVYVDNFVASAQASGCNLTHDLTVNMVDSYGDGWNGNVLTVGDASFTIEDGSEGTGSLCLDDGSFAVACGGGSYQTEVSWSIVDAAGTVLLEGGAPYDGVLLLGDATEVLGCTDPAAINYDPNATFNDGSCYYQGDSCSIALDFVTAGGTLDGVTP
ncbi:MAG: hypothetical protein QF780_06445, partial [Candidatus Marinimicrobia bacterium]|nr:hypothetical protein [Candidatus Neomarinimicrobiota bacterium]